MGCLETLFLRENDMNECGAGKQWKLHFRGDIVAVIYWSTNKLCIVKEAEF